MKTKIIYLKGDLSDESRLDEAALQGFKLQSVTSVQGQVVGYLVREPWLEETKELKTNLDAYVDKPLKNMQGHSGQKRK